MPVRFRPDAISLHVHEIRTLLPSRKSARLVCPTCGRTCQMVFLHPESPDEWRCNLYQQFTAMRNGRYSVSALARARNAVHRLAREHLRHAAA